MLIIMIYFFLCEFVTFTIIMLLYICCLLLNIVEHEILLKVALNTIILTLLLNCLESTNKILKSIIISVSILYSLSTIKKFNMLFFTIIDNRTVTAIYF